MSADVFFAYSARDAAGALVRGTLEASGPANALARLHTRALLVTDLRRAKKPRAPAFRPAFSARASVVQTMRSLAMLFGAGIPMRDALRSAAAQCADAGLRERIGSVGDEIERGSSFAEALKRGRLRIPASCVAMIAAGELSGSLDDVLARIADLLERQRALHNKLAAALTYPTIVAASAMALFVFMVVSVVPMFASLFAQLQVPLPPQTSMLVSLGRAAQSPYFAFSGCALLAMLAGACWWVKSCAPSAAVLDAFVLRLPVAGHVLRSAAHARFARTLATLLRCGVGLLASLHAAEDCLGNRLYRRGITAAAAAVREGEPLAAALAACGAFDPLLINMVAVGEQTGRIDELLAYVANHYDANLETSLASLSAALEPALMLVFGGGVAALVFSLYLPLYSLIGNLQ